MEHITYEKKTDSKCTILAFTSPCGGCGSSSAAAACARHFALQGKKTLYLNLEVFGAADMFFSGEGSFCMSDVISAFHEKKEETVIMLKNYMKQDQCGVYFFSAPNTVLEMEELIAGYAEEMISEIQKMGIFDYIILDMDFILDAIHWKLYRQAYRLVLVGNGSDISNIKILRACHAFRVREQGKDADILDRTVLLYNKFNHMMGNRLEDIGLKNLGTVPPYENASVEQVLDELSVRDMFDELAAEEPAKVPIPPAPFAEPKPEVPIPPAPFAEPKPEVPIPPAPFAEPKPEVPIPPASFAEPKPEVPIPPASFAEPKPEVPIPPAPVMDFGETTVLSGEMEGTTVLKPEMLGAKAFVPYLVRMKNNEEIIIDRAIYRIGKESGNADYVVYDNSAVSRKHADILIHDGRYFIVDLDSTNHTYVNGTMIESKKEIEIVHGTRIRLADEDFEFRIR